MEWQVTLPCLPSMVPVARRLVRGLLPDSPRIDDAELVLAELVGNAVRFGSGELTIGVSTAAGLARLVVTDLGRGDEDPAGQVVLDDFEETGWGLLIVNVLAERWGFDRELDGHESLWAELTW